jgi:hypothetical protein
MKLKELYEKHPEWHDLELVIYCPDGHYDYIEDGTGFIYEAKDEIENIDVLVVSPN